MAKNVYACFTCGRWFETTAQLRKHKCGQPLPESTQAPPKEEVKEPVKKPKTEKTVSKAKPKPKVQEIKKPEKELKVPEKEVEKKVLPKVKKQAVKTTKEENDKK